MKIFRFAFNILGVCGSWKPQSWTSRWKKALYTVYAIFQFLVIHSFALSQCAAIVFSVNSIGDFTETAYMILTTINSCCKFTTFLVKHKKIKMLLGKLDEKPFKPTSVEEFKIQDKFNRTILLRMVKIAIFVESAIVIVLTLSLFTQFTSKQLIYKAWLPYNYSIMNLYVPTYVHQMVGLTLMSNLAIGCDSIMCGFLTHICCQIEILQHRLKNITPNTANNISDCVVHHEYIYRYAITINENFQIVIGVQFICSTLAVCVSLYALTNTPMGPNFVQFILYMTCMLTDIFIYCWHGNQLKDKSTELIDTVFEMKWPDFENSTRKDILMIMRRAMIPIEFTCAYVVSMDLETFMGILKLSYSIYNVL